MTKGVEKLGAEKDLFLKQFEKASERIKKIVEDQYDAIFRFCVRM